MPESVHQLAVDHSESRSELLDAVRRSGAFEVRMVHLATGDYLIDDQVLIERKSVVDFTASVVDRRLFPQVARFAHSRYRSLLLIDGPTPSSIPGVHPHSLEGARVDRLHVAPSSATSSDPGQSMRMLRLVSEQMRGPHARVPRRFDRKPTRLASRRLFLLQALPGVGPALADRLLDPFGTIEHVFTADASALNAVRGVDPKTTRIRELVR